MELLPKEPYKRAVYIIFYAILASVLTYFFLEHALAASLPFVIGFLIAHSVQAKARALAKRTGGSERAFSLALGLFLLISAALIIFAFGAKLWQELYELAKGLPHLSEALSLRLEELSEKALGLLLKLFPDTEAVREGAAALAEKAVSAVVSALSTRLPAFMGAVLSAVPRILLFFGALLLSCVYFCLDYGKVRGFALRLCARAPFSALRRVPRASLSALAKYFRATAVIFLITAAELFVGFLLLGQRYAWLLAAVTAFVDVLPLFGSGAVLLPYAAASFALGQTGRGVGLLMLWGAVSLARQLTEPVIMGKRLGVHPLVNIAAVYAGYMLFGVTGVIFLPIAAVVLKSLFAKE